MRALLAWKSCGLESRGDVLLGSSDGEGKRELIYLFIFLRGSLGILICRSRLSEKSDPRHFTRVVLSYPDTEANQSSEEPISKPDFCQNL